MTYKQILIEYLKKKHEILQECSEEPYLLPGDLEDVEKWSAKDIKGFLLGLKRAQTDSDICPWCFKYKCCCCPYAKRHNDLYCNKKNSSYQKIMDDIFEIADFCPEHMGTLPEMEDLINETIDKVNKKLERGKK